MKDVLKNLPGNGFWEVKRELMIKHQSDRQTQILPPRAVRAAAQELAQVLRPPAPDPLRGRVYSQTGRTGLISESSTASAPPTGISWKSAPTGLENNTALLYSEGWQGLWVEGDPAANEQAAGHWPEAFGEGRLKAVTAMVTAENFQDLLRDNSVRELDLLSLDIDHNITHS